MEILGKQQFETLVINASRQAPVVVDFWAPWCAPCRALAPTLERVVASLGGQVTLCKLNVDEPDNQEVAASFDIKSIPAVKVFYQGRVASEFVGAQGEAEIRRVITRVLPSKADGHVAAARLALAQQDTVTAAEQLQHALRESPGHPGASVALARIRLGEGNGTDAVTLLQGAPQWEGALQAEGQALLAQAQFALAAQRGDGTRAQLEERVARNSKDLPARMALGRWLASQGDFEAALDQFLSVMGVEKRFDEDAPRKAMLDVFAIVGPRSDLAEDYRKRMANLLFS